MLGVAWWLLGFLEGLIVFFCVFFFFLGGGGGGPGFRVSGWGLYEHLAIFSLFQGSRQYAWEILFPLGTKFLNLFVWDQRVNLKPYHPTPCSDGSVSWVCGRSSAMAG